MANYTKNYNLLKPLKTEKADVSIINGNMDEIDLILKSISETVSSNANHNHDGRYYTESEINDKLLAKASLADIPTKVSKLTNDLNYVTSNEMKNYAQPSGNYINREELGYVAFTNSYSDLNNKPNIPSKTSELENDAGFLTKANSEVAYNLGVSSRNATNGNVKIKLASSSNNDEVPIKGTGSVTVETDSTGAIIINSNSSSGTVIVCSSTEPTDVNKGSIWIE